jgi:hypothetical protein
MPRGVIHLSSTLFNPIKALSAKDNVMKSIVKISALLVMSMPLWAGDMTSTPMQTTTTTTTTHSMTKMMDGTMDCKGKMGMEMDTCKTTNMDTCKKSGMNEMECSGMMDKDGNIMVKADMKDMKAMPATTVTTPSVTTPTVTTPAAPVKY